MKRVLATFGIRSFILLTALFTLIQTSNATTAVRPSDDDLIIGARAIVRGKVVSIDSAYDETSGRVYTYITVKVKEVIKGQITERRIVLKELGGRADGRAMAVYGNPEFKRGERVFLYLDTWADGSLRTYQMFLGKFSILQDERTGQRIVARDMSNENVVLLENPRQSGKRSTDRMELSAYTEMVRERIGVTAEASQAFEARYYEGIAVNAEPPEFPKVSRSGDLSTEFTFLGNARWFEPDTGQAVAYTVNPNPSSVPGFPPLSVPESDVAAAANAWSVVPGCALRVSYAGQLSACYTESGTPGINVVSNNCDGRNAPSSTCSGILAWGGWSAGTGETKVINGVSFQRITQGFISFNPYATCYFGDHCNVQEITTHELGHALGLGHSADSTATMYAYAHFDGRCASIKTDDANGITFIYPGSSGGPGPLSISTSSLAAGTVGSAYSQSLLASGGTSPYTWSLVSGQGALPAGLSLSTGGVISGTPTTAGTSNFTVKVTDAASGTAQKALSITVTTGAALASQFVSQTVPASLQPGQSFNANLKFTNTGTQTWSGSPYWLVSQNPALNTTWGGNGVPLSSYTVSPGQQLDVTFTAYAPLTPGTYNFQWQLYQNGGVGFFGQMSTNVVIQVGSSGPNYAGAVDSADCNMITGWAADRNRLNTSINVSIYDGSTLLTTVLANALRSDVGAYLGDNGLHGFAVSTPVSLKDGQSHNVQVKFESSTTQLGNSPKAITCSIGTPNYAGALDSADCNTISGWAADRNRLNTSINVSVYDGATLLTTVPADQLRGDVGAYLGDNGLHGFSLSTPTGLKDGQSHNLYVKFESSATNLGNSPKTVNCSTGSPNYAGAVDSADCNMITGWAADRNRLNTSINVSVYDGSTLLATVLANQLRGDVGAYLGDNGLHGFSISTPASLKDGQQHNVQVKFESSPTALGNSPKAVNCSGSGTNYAGFVDSADCNMISGWAADRNRLNTSITVSIYDGATLLTTVTANQLRGDVGAYLGDNGLHGFAVPTPASLKDGQSHSVHVKFESSPSELGNSPKTITGCSP